MISMSEKYATEVIAKPRKGKLASLYHELLVLVDGCNKEDELKRENEALQSELDEMMMRLCERLRDLEDENDNLRDNINKLKQENTTLKRVLKIERSNDNILPPLLPSAESSPKKRKAYKPLLSPTHLSRPRSGTLI